jgi:hypothetical protein
MPAWLPGAIVGFLSLILTLAIYQSNRKQAREQIQVADFAKAKSDITALQITIAEINVKLQVFWKDVAFDAAKILHRPHPDAAEMDRLIDQYLADHLTGTELKRFIILLEATRDNATLPEGRRLAASQMLRALKQRYELVDFQTALAEMVKAGREGLEELGRALDSRKK